MAEYQGEYIDIKSGKFPLWNVAEKAYGDGTKWAKIWNHPANFMLRRKRGSPGFVQQGDRVWIPPR